MADVKALDMDVVTEKSGHNIVGMAVSVCITPAAPSPLPMPYPLTGSVAEGIADSPLRTKVCGTNAATIGSVAKACHGNEPGTLKEVVSLNTAGPCAPLTGAFTVLCELGAFAITGSMGMMNKGITVGMGSNASDADGDASGSGAGGASGDGGDPSKPDNQSQSGSGSGGNSDGAAASGGDGGSDSGNAGKNDPSKPDKDARPGEGSGADAGQQCQDGHPVDLASGAVVDEAVDLAVPGLIPLVFKRYYSSLRRRDDKATLGPGWAHGFEQRIEATERTFALRDGQGRWIYFDKVAVGGSTFHRGERLTLSRPAVDEYRVLAQETRRASVFAPVREGGAPVLRRIEDPYGNAITFEYTGEKLARVIDTVGRAVNVAWQGRRIASLTVVAGGSGAVVTYDYDRRGRLRTVTDPLGHAEWFEYDGASRMVSTTTRSGATFAYEYEGGSGRCKATYGPEGLFAVHLTRYEDEHRTVTDGEEPRVVMWNDKGLPERILLPDGTRLEEAAYDADGLVIARANGAGEGWQFWNDERGRRIRTIDPGGQVTAFEYSGDCLARTVGPDGQATCYAHDDRGALIRIDYAWGEQAHLRHDAKGRITELEDASGRTAFEYDDENNLVAETDGRGSRTTYRYDGFGRAVARRDALGRETRVTYDPRGRRTSITQADGTTTTFGYDAAGNLARVVDPLGGTTRFHYTGFRALSRVVGPDGWTWRIEHTKHERVRRVVNPLGEEYVFERDLAGRVASETTFDGQTHRYERDGAGRVTRVTYPDGDARIFGYDACGRVVRDATRDEARTYARDALGRLSSVVLESSEGRHETRYELDAFGRILSEGQGDRRVRYERDAFGRRVARTLPNGATTRYGYEGARLAAIEHAGTRVTFGRDALGREVTRDTGTLRMASEYSDADRLVALRVESSGAAGEPPSTLVHRRFAYDRVGRLTQVDDDRWGETRYAYDKRDQVVEVRRAAGLETFAYDPAGSILETLRSFEGARRQEKHEVGPGNLVASAGATKFAYDKRGRRVRKSTRTEADAGETTAYEWDARDQLRAATLPDGTRVAFAYDALGRRVRRESKGPSGPARVTEYVWDGTVLAMEVDSGEGVRTFVHAPDTFVPLLQEERGEVFAYVVDPAGTPRELLDQDGSVAWSAAHGAWGDIVAEHVDPKVRARIGRPVRSPFRLLGQIADDALGLAFTMYRAFDPAIGRWCTPDPLGLRGGKNLFGFGGSPMNDVDPLGLTPHGMGQFPPGSTIVDDKSPSHVVYKTADGEDRIRFKADQAMTLQEARPGRNYTTDSRAGVNDQGQPYVFEGRHRAIGASQGATIGADNGGVPDAPGHLDYKYTSDSASGGVPVKSLSVDNKDPDCSAAEADQKWKERYGG
jgi:RHS repeat-associated protein